MDDFKELVSLETALNMLPKRDDERIHTYRTTTGFAIGADWDRAQIIDVLTAAKEIEISGKLAQATGHGLAVWDEHGPLFIETARSTQ